MLVRVDALFGGLVALAHGGEEIVVVLVRAVVAPFLVDREEAGELYHLPGGAQFVLAGRVAQGDGRALQRGRRHLARHSALEDQVVKAPLVTAAGAILAEIGRADGFVRFLSIFRLAAVKARLFGSIIVAEALGNRIASRHDRAHVHLHAIGTHVGDRARFVERLRATHRMAGGEAELARCFLLQGGSGERRRGISLERLGLDVLDREAPAIDCGLGGHRAAFVAEGHLVELVARELDQPRIESRPVMLHASDDGPIFLRPEGLDLPLPLADQPQGDRLDAARALGTGQLAPQHRREREAEQVIECATGKVSLHQITVDLARGFHSVGDCLLGDRVEGHPLHLGGQRLALLQQVEDVPADRFPFAVGVSREDEAVALLRGIGDGLHLLAIALVGIDLPVHREVLVRAHAAVLGRQVADVAVAGEDLVIPPKVFLDGFGLGRRFDDNELHCGFSVPLRVYVYVRASLAPRRRPSSGVVGGVTRTLR